MPSDESVVDGDGLTQEMVFLLNLTTSFVTAFGLFMINFLSNFEAVFAAIMASRAVLVVFVGVVMQTLDFTSNGARRVAKDNI